MILKRKLKDIYNFMIIRFLQKFYKNENKMKLVLLLNYKSKDKHFIQNRKDCRIFIKDKMININV